jgi:hypothetical protein
LIKKHFSRKGVNTNDRYPLSKSPASEQTPKDDNKSQRRKASQSWADLDTSSGMSLYLPEDVIHPTFERKEPFQKAQDGENLPLQSSYAPACAA